MKVNVPVRFKNPWFWVGVCSVAITAIGVDPQTFPLATRFFAQVLAMSP